MTQKIAPVYANAELRVKPGSPIHRLVALLFDTYCDDVTAMIPDLERMVEAHRWCDATGKRVEDGI